MEGEKRREDGSEVMLCEIWWLPPSSDVCFHRVVSVTLPLSHPPRSDACKCGLGKCGPVPPCPTLSFLISPCRRQPSLDLSLQEAAFS